MKKASLVDGGYGQNAELNQVLFSEGFWYGVGQARLIVHVAKMTGRTESE
jgi:hypothetical protein